MALLHLLPADHARRQYWIIDPRKTDTGRIVRHDVVVAARHSSAVHPRVCRRSVGGKPTRQRKAMSDGPTLTIKDRRGR